MELLPVKRLKVRPKAVLAGVLFTLSGCSIETTPEPKPRTYEIEQVDCTVVNDLTLIVHNNETFENIAHQLANYLELPECEKDIFSYIINNPGNRDFKDEQGIKEIIVPGVINSKPVL